MNSSQSLCKQKVHSYFGEGNNFNRRLGLGGNCVREIMMITSAKKGQLKQWHLVKYRSHSDIVLYFRFVVSYFHYYYDKQKEMTKAKPKTRVQNFLTCSFRAR